MLNRAVTMGRLTHNPELKTTQAGAQFCRFSIACDRDFKNASDERETDFFDCMAWRKTAEFVSRYFAKGHVIIVEGQIQDWSWADKEGNKRCSTEIIIDAAYFSDSKPKGGDGEPPELPAGGGDGFGFSGGFNPDLSGVGGGMGSGSGADGDDGELSFQHAYNWEFSAMGVFPASTAEKHHTIGREFIP